MWAFVMATEVSFGILCLYVVYMRMWLLLRSLHTLLAMFQSFPINNERESVYIPSLDKNGILLSILYKFFINKSRINSWTLSRYKVFYHTSDVKTM
jgi:hypothetical protein